MFRIFCSISLVCFNVLFLQACKSLPTQGHFEGILYKYPMGNSKMTQELISLDIFVSQDSSMAKPALQLKVRDLSQNLLQEIKVFDFQSKNLKVVLPLIQEGPIQLQRRGDCYKGQIELEAPHLREIDLCFTNQTISVDVRGANDFLEWTLTATRFSSPSELQFEIPKTWKLSQLVDYALTHSFGSQIELENVIQAKNEVMSNFFALFPRLNIGTLAWNIGAGKIIPYTMIATLGDLAPFLIPTRWIEIPKSKFLAQAMQTSKMLFHANLIVEVEILAHLFEKNRQILKIYEELLAKTKLIREVILEVEKKKKITSNSIQLLDIFYQLTESNMKEVSLQLSKNRFALSKCLGLSNPEGIKNIDFDQEDSHLMQTEKINSYELAQIAVNRSFEIKQLDEIIKSAKYQKLQLYFSWLDPQAIPQHNLGPSLFSEFRINKSKINQLRIHRLQLISFLAHDAFNAAESHNQALEGYKAISQGKEVARHYLNQVMLNASEHDLDIKDIIAAVETYLLASIRVIEFKSVFEIASAKIARIKLTKLKSF